VTLCWNGLVCREVLCSYCRTRLKVVTLGDDSLIIRLYCETLPFFEVAMCVGMGLVCREVLCSYCRTRLKVETLGDDSLIIRLYCKTLPFFEVDMCDVMVR
jgi:hypothetical protein